MGYLSAVYHGWHQGFSQIEDICRESVQPLFGDWTRVKTEEECAEKVLAALDKNCGRKAVHILYYAFLTEDPQKERELLLFLREAFRYKKEILAHRHICPVWSVCERARAVSRERHRMLGLVRFRELRGGLLYGGIEPKYPVVPIMADHFMRRLPQETWVLHDRKRKTAVYYDGKEAVLGTVPELNEDMEEAGKEKEIAALWRAFYQAISIPERKNESLRRQNMPKKYWKYLPELAPEKSY